MLLLLACSGAEPEAPPPSTGAASSVPDALVAATWQVRMASAAARAPFEGQEGWVAWYDTRPADALRAFDAANDAEGAARVHLYYAGLYRQALLLATRATTVVWGDDVQPTDPGDVACLVGIAGALGGDAAARDRLAGCQVPSGNAAVHAQAKLWQAWGGDGAAWPPAVPVAAGPGAVPVYPEGAPLPAPAALPHYTLYEQTAEHLAVPAADLGALWALAAWHEQAALAGPAPLAAAVPAWLDPWRLPTESAAAGDVGELPDSLLFMSTYSTAGDLAFVRALAAGGSGPAAVEGALATHGVTSPYAAAIAPCITGGTVAPDCVTDASIALGAAITTAMATANGGQVESFHRPFSDYARLGVVVAARAAALAAGDDAAAGRLLLLELDRAVGPARDPLLLLSIAAWDVRNRYSLRATEIVHGLLTQAPGLDVARLPLDALHVRLSRNAAPGRPMH